MWRTYLALFIFLKLALYYKANNYLIKDYVQGVYMTSSAGLYFKDAKVVAK